MQRSAECNTGQTMVYRSSHRQLITANLATGDVVVMDSNSLQYCTQTVIALVYRPRFKITRSIDHTNEGLYLQCCHDNRIMHIEINLNLATVKDLKLDIQFINKV